MADFTTAQRTFSFPLYPTRSQERELFEWLNLMRRVWNRGLALLEWNQYYRRYQKCLETSPPSGLIFDPDEFGPIAPVPIQIRKVGNDWVYSSPLGFKYREDRTKSWDEPGNVKFAYVRVRQDDSADRGYRINGWLLRPEDDELMPEEGEWFPPRSFRVKPHWQSDPPIGNSSYIELRKPFAQKRWKDDEGNPIKGDCPQTYVNEFIEDVLADSWTRYQKGEAGRPHYKKRDKGDVKNRVDTISSKGFRAQIDIKEGGRILFIPGLGDMVVHGFDTDLMPAIEKQRTRMRANPDAYPQLEAKLAEGRGFNNVVTWLQSGRSLPQSEGKELDKELENEERWTKAAFKRAISLQKKGKSQDEIISSLQKSAANRGLESAIDTLCMPGSYGITRDPKGKGWEWTLHVTMPIDIKLPPKNGHTTGVDVGLQYLYTTTDGVKVKRADCSKEEGRIAVLKQAQATKTVGSVRWRELQQQINALETKMTRKKQGQEQYHVQWICDRSESIAVKDATRTVKAVARPQPIPRKVKEGYVPNGATAKSTENRDILGSRMAGFVSALERGATVRQRNFQRVAVPEEAGPSAVLEASDFPTRVMTGDRVEGGIPSYQSESARIGTSPQGGEQVRESDSVATPPSNQMQAPVPAVPAGTPRPTKVKPRNRRRERQIG